LTAGSVNFTFWAAFITATEVYEEADKTPVRDIFASTHITSMQNRINVKRILEEVWWIREVEAIVDDVEQG
jgi:hypothetical protein